MDQHTQPYHEQELLDIKLAFIDMAITVLVASHQLDMGLVHHPWAEQLALPWVEHISDDQLLVPPPQWGMGSCVHSSST